MASSSQKRVILWAVPRGTSTAFCRTMMHRNNTKVVMEPFYRAFYQGPGRVSKRDMYDMDEKYTFDFCKAEIENTESDEAVFFVKEMASFTQAAASIADAIPKGFVNTFLIRHPKKATPSLYKLITSGQTPGFDGFDPIEASYKQIYDVFKYVTEELKQEAIVVDSDDLLTDPEGILKLYCSKVGIDYQDAMVNWGESPAQLDEISEWVPWFQRIMTSSKLEPPSKAEPDLSFLPSDVQSLLEENIRYYDEMYKYRLQVN